MLALFAADTPQNSLVNLDTWLIVLGVLTPFVTALFTKWRAPDWLKSIVSLVVTAAVTVVKKGADDGALTWAVFFNGWVQILGAHLGSWLLTSDFVAKVNQATGRVGLGAPVTVEPIKPTPPPVDGVATQGE